MGDLLVRLYGKRMWREAGRLPKCLGWLNKNNELDNIGEYRRENGGGCETSGTSIKMMQLPGRGQEEMPWLVCLLRRKGEREEASIKHER